MQAWDRLIADRNSDFATVHIEIERDYYLFLQGVRFDFPGDRNLLRSHVELVIWGCLLVEALANRKLFEIVASQASGELLDDYWEMLQLKPILNKLERIMKQYKRSEWSLWRARLRGEFEFRDRLVHYKEGPKKFNRAAALREWEANGKPGEFLDHIPPTGIFRNFTQTEPEDRRLFYFTVAKFLFSLEIKTGTVRANKNGPY